MKKTLYAIGIGAVLEMICAGPISAQQNEPDLRAEAIRAMKQAASFYRNKVASHGGYVYYSSVDLDRWWGEGETTADTIFVEPPGTPAVGMAYLTAHAATGDAWYRDAAREVALALVHGQLESGGWAQVIHFAPPKSGRLGKYRTGRPAGTWNASSLDDGQTQAALQLLIRVDQVLKFQDAPIHDAAKYGLDGLLRAQFPNGAFPQSWTGPAEQWPVVKARFPDHDWKTEGKIKEYWTAYTLNDNLAGTVAETLIVAHQIYGDEKYREALKKLGDFLILAQMPDPQPGWCQQYGPTMEPIWARKFEPPAITGWESQDVMRTLIRIAQYTGEKKYLEPIPRALNYFRKSLLPDGRVARYYELQKNQPIYMDDRYQLTYDDSHAPTHYGWKQPARFDEIEKAYQAAIEGGPARQIRPVKVAAGEVRKRIRDLDSQGRWVSTYAGERLAGQPKFERGFRYLSSDVFNKSVKILSSYIENP